MPEAPGGDRTERATPRRLRTARRDGQLGNTPELGSWLSLLAASFVLPQVAVNRPDQVSVGQLLAQAVGRFGRRDHVIAGGCHA